MRFPDIIDAIYTTVVGGFVGGFALAACRAEAFRLISGEVLPARTFIGRLMVSRTGCDSV
jgi:hypothetical protein